MWAVRKGSTGAPAAAASVAASFGLAVGAGTYFFSPIQCREQLATIHGVQQSPRQLKQDVYAHGRVEAWKAQVMIPEATKASINSVIDLELRVTDNEGTITSAQTAATALTTRVTDAEASLTSELLVKVDFKRKEPFPGMALRSMAKELQNDRRVVLEAVRQDGLALQFASPQFLSDKEVVYEAVNQCSAAFDFVQGDLRSDPELLSMAGWQAGW